MLARPRILRFFALAYALSWLAWLPLVLAKWGWIENASPYWHLVGGLGPAVAALICVRPVPGGIGAILSRCLRAPPRWIAFAIGVPLVVFGASAAVLAIAGANIDPGRIGESLEYPSLGIAGYVIANIVCYGFGEEIGWRGFALPRFAHTMSLSWAAAFVAIGWAGWHLPLFVFSSGMSQMGAFGIVGWLASIASGSLLMAWLYQRSGSILVVALFHAALDVLIMSPTGGPLQSTMGAAITILGFVVPMVSRSTASAGR